MKLLRAVLICLGQSWPPRLNFRWPYISASRGGTPLPACPSSSLRYSCPKAIGAMQSNAHLEPRPCWPTLSALVRLAPTRSSPRPRAPSGALACSGCSALIQAALTSVSLQPPVGSVDAWPLATLSTAAGDHPDGARSSLLPPLPGPSPWVATPRVAPPHLKRSWAPRGRRGPGEHEGWKQDGLQRWAARFLPCLAL